MPIAWMQGSGIKRVGVAAEALVHSVLSEDDE
jgi:hypothetical protein